VIPLLPSEPLLPLLDEEPEPPEPPSGGPAAPDKPVPVESEAEDVELLFDSNEECQQAFGS
jgi:hypothetical protein